MIFLAESLEERPIDRDYNLHGGLRITQPEVLGGGIAYCVRKAYPGEVIIYEKKNNVCDDSKVWR